MAKAKKKKTVSDTRVQPQMKIVPSEVCATCKTPCTRGLAYLARLQEPGTIGKGVPCILTLQTKK